MTRIERQPEPQPSRPASETKSKKGGAEKTSASNTMLKSIDTVRKMISTRGSFILRAGKPATYDKSIQNPKIAARAENVRKNSLH